MHVGIIPILGVFVSTSRSQKTLENNEKGQAKWESFIQVNYQQENLICVTTDTPADTHMMFDWSEKVINFGALFNSKMIQQMLLSSIYHVLKHCYAIVFYFGFIFQWKKL